jgi:hypothetical protein
MKKDYDLSKVQNELKGASSFFKKPPASPAIPQEAPLPAPARSQPKPTTPPPTPIPEAESRPGVRPVRPVRPVRRQMIRHPFELYQDQVEALRHLAADERMRGGTGSMSAMVRQAIDRLIDEASTKSE